MTPHHRPSASDGIAEPIPGLMAGGPNNSLTNGAFQDPALVAKIPLSTPPARCYLDDVNSYASNEIAINWNAPLVFVAGYFAGDGSTAGVNTREQAIPAGFQLDQNFPNPFNPSTTISFAMPAESVVSIDIFDTLGRMVSTVVDAELPAGYHTVTFDGSALASGVYLYRMTAKSARFVFTDTKRFMLVK
jgi:endoglucanase